MARRRLFDYVPPEERRGGIRKAGFVAAALLTMSGGIAIAYMVKKGVYIGIRYSIAALVAGLALWLWLREDPDRR